MYDTWAKTPSGLLHGSRINPGRFTDCVEFRYDTIQGQHCMVSLSMSNLTLPDRGHELSTWDEIGSLAHETGLDFVQGVCLPASCSKEKVLRYINGVVGGAFLKGTEVICRTNDPVSIETIDYFAL